MHTNLTPYQRAQLRHAELDKHIELLNAAERVFIATTVGSLAILGAVCVVEGVLCLSPVKTVFLSTLTAGGVGWRLLPKLEDEDREEQSFNSNIFIPEKPNPNGVVELVMGSMIRLAKKHTFFGKLFPDKKPQTLNANVSMVPDISVKEILLRTNELTARIQKSQQDKAVWRRRTLGLLLATGCLCGVDMVTEKAEPFVHMGTVATFFGGNMWGAATFMEQRRRKTLHTWNNMFSFTLSPETNTNCIVDVPTTALVVSPAATPVQRHKWIQMFKQR